MPHGQSPMVNIYNMNFTVSGAASDYDLFTPNRRQQNNNNNNANRERPGRGRALRGVAPARGIPNRGVHGRAAPGRGAVPNRGAHGRAAPGRGVPARGGVPRGVPGHGNPPRRQGPPTVPGRNPQGNPPLPNLGGRNHPNPNLNPNPNPNPPPKTGDLGGPGRPMGGLPTGRGANPAVVANLNRLVQVQEKQVSDKKDTKCFTQFPSEKFDRTELGKSLDHWIYSCNTGITYSVKVMYQARTMLIILQRLGNNSF